MSSARFRRLIEDAYINDSYSSAVEAYKEYQDTHCLHPRMQEIIDSHTQTRRVIEVACGRCMHCLQTKINEWCTRMYAHAEDFKNVYFVTLTYRSFTDFRSPVSRLIVDKLVQAVWHMDDLNTFHKSSYNPCLLVKDHYQRFLKRLRKNTGLKDITYVLSGEYGHKFGRPHFHMILFTNGELTKRDIVRAWSVCLWRKDSGEFEYRKNQKNNGMSVDFPIGRVDFHDLVRNGTFNTTAKIKIDGTFMNAANCFSYVCKYVVKRDNVNYSRVRMAYDSLYQKARFTKVFEKDVPFEICKQYLMQLGYTCEYSESIINKQKQLSYEKVIYQPRSIYAESLQLKKHVSQPYEYDLEFFPTNYQDFRNSYRPFCEFSRGTPIGSLYAKRHIQEFTQDVYNKPLLQESGFVVPSYFRTKAKNKLYGLRKIHHTIKGDSHVLSGLVDLERHFQDALSDVRVLREYLGSRSDYETINKDIRNLEKVFVDESTGERIILFNNTARHFRYDRSKRKYVFTRDVTISDWLNYWLQSLKSEQERHKIAVSRSRERLRYDDASFCILSGFGLDIEQARSQYEQNQKYLLEHHQHLYHSTHSSAE